MKGATALTMLTVLLVVTIPHLASPKKERAHEVVPGSMVSSSGV